MKSVSPERAVDRLRAGGLLVHPTEGVYGLGGALDGGATGRLRAAKARPESGFVVLLPEPDPAAGLRSSLASFLAAAFWPGPLTLILDDPDHRFPADVKAPDGSVAVRRCGNEVTNRILDLLGAPITSTSANRPGDRPARTLAEGIAAAEALGLEVVGVDGGGLDGDAPSTIVDVRSGTVRVLREGGIPAAEIGRVVALQARKTS